MISSVADTHVVIWWLFDSAKLSDNAAQSIRSAAANRDKIAVSAITLIEVVYLIEKGKVPVETFTAIARILQNSNGVFEEVPINLDIARAMYRVELAKV